MFRETRFLSKQGLVIELQVIVMDHSGERDLSINIQSWREGDHEDV